MAQVFRGVEIVLALVGAGHLLDTDLEHLHRPLDSLRHRFARRYPNSPFALLTPLETPAEVAAARYFAANGWRIYVPPSGGDARSLEQLSRDAPDADIVSLPEHFAAVREPTTQPESALRAGALCRYAHALIVLDSGADAQNLGGFAGETLATWRSRAFPYGDEQTGDDAGALLPVPSVGPAVHVDVTATAPGAKRKAIAWLDMQPVIGEPNALSEDFGPRIPRAHDTLRDLDQLNHDLLRARDRDIDKCSATLLSEGALAELGPRRLTPWQLDLFGRADQFAINEKKTLTRFSLFYAIAAPASVLAFEALTAQPSAGLAWGVTGYAAILGLVLLIALLVISVRALPRMLNARLLAELLRVQIFWHVAGVQSRLETGLRRWSPHDMLPILPAARWLDFMRQTTQPEGSNVAFAERHWLGLSVETMGSPRQAFAQTTWHSRRSKQHRAEQQALDLAQILVFAVAFCWAMVLAANINRTGTALNIGYATIAVSVLPAIAGGLAIFRERMGYQTFAENYARMDRISRRTRVLLTAADTAGDHARRSQLLDQFGREAVGEAIEWMSAQRLRRIEPAVVG